MKKSDIRPLPEYFDRYITLVEDIELEEAFQNSIKDLTDLDIPLLNKIGSRTYQQGKWEIKEIIQHISDIERILTAGTLCFVRNENKHIITFNEEEIARNSKAKNKNLTDIIDELISIRKSTLSLYQSFDKDDLLKTGINWKYEISVLAMGFNIIGHQTHHLNFIKSNYYPLLRP